MSNEFSELIDAYLDGELAPSATEKLRAWLSESEANVDVFAQHVFLHQQLRETLVAHNAIECLGAVSATGGDAGPGESCGPLPCDLLGESSLDSPAVSTYGFLGNLFSGFPGSGSGASMVFFVALFSAVVGGIVTALVFSAIPSTPRGSQLAHIRSSSETEKSLVMPVAYLTSANGCDWGERSPDLWQVGRNVQRGDELVLHEGIAEFRLASGVSLSVEGPAALVMTSPASLVLQHGKVTVYVPWAVIDFKLNTPAGRLTASDTEFGVNVAGDKTDIHVFAGQVLASPTLDGSLNEDDEQVVETIVEHEKDLVSGSEFSKSLIAAGRGLELVSRGEVTKVVRWHAADAAKFATKLTMAGSLPVTSNYVDAVMASKPISYWRFEKCKDSLVSNEISDGTDLKVVNGELHLGGDSSNRVAEFGRPGSESYLLSEKTLNLSPGTDYSVELWIKPSHIHDGSCVSMLVDESIGKKEKASLYMQTCGFNRRNPIVERSRIRFLHRDPPGSSGGTSCFSKSPYTPRRWQHVVAVKEGPAMRLYIDGVVTSTKQDKGSLTAGLRLLVGQLGIWKRAHPFIGQMDELAIYDHALSTEEILQHIKAIHWKSEHEKTAGLAEI
jgi:hypothetical protein